MNLKEFLSELKRRKVYRVSIAYGIAAWVLAQIAELITDSFEADPWANDHHYLNIGISRHTNTFLDF